MSGILPYLALMLWVPVTVVLFAAVRPTYAVLATVLGGTLLLPERVAFDAPGIPRLDKHTIAMLCALCGMLATDRKRLRQARLGRGVELLGLLGAVATIGTVLTNTDPVVYGPTVLRGLGFRDVISGFATTVIEVVLPFYLGRAMFRSREDVCDLLRGLAIAGMAYAPLVLIELRFSPQLHLWVYGFRQHSWSQVLRGGGYRPMVFMNHGLAVALFVCVSAMSAWILLRARVCALGSVVRTNAYVSGIMLALIHSLGALVYGVVAFLSLFLGSARLQSRLAVGLACVALAYPVLRFTDLFPTDDLVTLAERISAERSSSLAFRFKNEDELLEKAWERRSFGWGGFARNRVYDDSGRSYSVTDGAWIIYFGIAGAVGFIARFGMLVLPVFLASRRLRQRLPRGDGMLLAGLATIVAISVIDLLPNGCFTMLPYMLAGALAGACEQSGRAA